MVCAAVMKTGTGCSLVVTSRNGGEVFAQMQEVIMEDNCLVLINCFELCLLNFYKFVSEMWLQKNLTIGNQNIFTVIIVLQVIAVLYYAVRKFHIRTNIDYLLQNVNFFLSK